MAGAVTMLSANGGELKFDGKRTTIRFQSPSRMP
jgi:hypothetical protein